MEIENMSVKEIEKYLEEMKNLTIRKQTPDMCGIRIIRAEYAKIPKVGDVMRLDGRLNGADNAIYVSRETIQLLYDNIHRLG